MSYRLGLDHVRKQHAIRLGKELRRARMAKGLSREAASRQLRYGASAFWAWENGHNLPTVETAQRLASALGAPVLVEIVLESRHGECPGCGKAFLHKGGSNRLYCSVACRRIVQKLRDAKGTPAERGIVAERQRALQQACIDAMCRACEPEGLCRDEECPLRLVSPLPLAREANDAMPVTPEPYGHARRWASLEHRAQQGQAARRYWTTRTPEERQEHMERARRMRWQKEAA